MTSLIKILDWVKVFGKSKILVLTVCCGHNDNFCAKSWTKMTIFLQNLRSGKSFGKNEIFNLDMSALNQNNNFKQNL